MMKDKTFRVLMSNKNRNKNHFSVIKGVNTRAKLRIIMLKEQY